MDDTDDTDRLYQTRLYALRDMIQQDIWKNRADLACKDVDEKTGHLLEDILFRYIKRIEGW